MEIVNIIKESGGDVTKTVMSHLDRTIFEYSGLVELAKTGCILEHDFFGIEVSHYQNNLAVDFLSDAQRIYRIKHLIDQGFEDQLVIAHDVHTRHRLVGAFYIFSNNALYFIRTLSIVMARVDFLKNMSGVRIHPASDEKLEGKNQCFF